MSEFLTSLLTAILIAEKVEKHSWKMFNALAVLALIFLGIDYFSPIHAKIEAMNMMISPITKYILWLLLFCYGYKFIKLIFFPSVRLKLFPVQTDIFGRKGIYPAWCIINMNDFDISIDEIGFSTCSPFYPVSKKKGNSSTPVLSAVITRCPERMQDKRYKEINFPILLRPREEITLASPDIYQARSVMRSNYDYMYVQTSCEYSYVTKAKSLIKTLALQNIS